jgi:L-seryl-tRNA(Ser) seleniumtransferase
MVMVLAGPQDSGPMGLEVLCPIAKEKGVPVLVDAAAERLTVPNVHLQRGATLVGYSGGKCLRGPQCAGLLLGRKDLIQAAWLHSAPHHAFGRPMKVGKEEIMGMLAAVEAWVKRDHDAEWKEWERWLNTISTSVTRVSGVTTSVRKPNGLSNNAPTLQIQWDSARLGLTGQDVARLLDEGDPRIVIAGGGGGGRGQGGSSTLASISIMPYMMMPGDDKIAAERIHAILSQPPKIDRPEPKSPSVDVSGQWDVKVEFVLGTANHGLVFEQKSADLVGTHVTEFLGGDVRGSVNGDEVRFRSSHRYEGTRLGYEFAGKVTGDTMEGTVQLGEYGQAKFKAARHKYGQPGGIVRPVKEV